MAEIGSIHRTYQQHLESGKRDARFTSLVRLAKALGVSLSELFEGLETGEPVRKRRVSPGEIDRDKLKAELAILERTVENLRALAVEPEPPLAKRQQRSQKSTTEK